MSTAKASPLWIYRIGGIDNGPVSGKDLRQLAQAGTLRADTLVRSQSSHQWIRASEVGGLFTTPPPPPPVGHPIARERAHPEAADLANELSGLLGAGPAAGIASPQPRGSETAHGAGIVIRERTGQLGAYVDHSFSKTLTPKIAQILWYLTLGFSVFSFLLLSYYLLSPLGELPPRLWVDPLKLYGAGIAVKLFVVLNIRLWLELCVVVHRLAAELRAR